MTKLRARWGLSHNLGDDARLDAQAGLKLFNPHLQIGDALGFAHGLGRRIVGYVYSLVLLTLAQPRPATAAQQKHQPEGGQPHFSGSGFGAVATRFTFSSKRPSSGSHSSASAAIRNLSA